MALGIDPGPPRATKKAAGVTWTVVEHRTSDARVLWRESGRFDPSLSTIESFALKMRAMDVVGLEYASGLVYEPFRAPPLLEQNIVAGAIAMAFSIQARSASLVRMSAQEWRKALTGKGTLGTRKVKITFDELIAQALSVNVVGAPKSLVSSTQRASHEADSCGIAIVAGRAFERGMVYGGGFMSSL